jgi:hypothetical protein
MNPAPHFGIQFSQPHQDCGACHRRELAHLLSLRRPDGWPVIGADQFIEDLLDGPLTTECAWDYEAVWRFARGGEIAFTTSLLLGRLSFAYRMVVGAIPVCASITWTNGIVAHPDWLWAQPGKQWAHPEITVFDSKGRHYCGPPFKAGRLSA